MVLRSTNYSSCSGAKCAVPWAARNVVSAALIVFPVAVIALRVVLDGDAVACEGLDTLLFLLLSSFLHGINFLQVLTP